MNEKGTTDSEKIRKHQEDVEVNLREFNGNGTKFASENIRNAALRKEYIDLTKNAAQEILQEARTSASTNPSRAVQIWEAAAEKASELRNIYLDQTRLNVSKPAAAFSKMLKEEGLTFPKLVQKYTLDIAETAGAESYATLELEEQINVMERIVAASGRTNLMINAVAKWAGRAALVLILITICISIYNICEAENHTLEAVKTAVSLGFGAAGGYAGVELGMAIGACGGPVGVLIGAIIGGIVGGFLLAFGGESLVNVLYRAFFPASAPGPGPPPFDVIPVLYGQPNLGCEPVLGLPEMREVPVVGPPSLHENPVVGLPKLW